MERSISPDSILMLKTAQSAGIDLATGYLKSFGTNGDPARATPPAQIAPTAAALRQTGQDGLARQHQLTRQQEQIERELAPLLAERERTGGARAQVSVVQVTLAAPQGVKITLLNDYPVEAGEGFPLIRLPDIPYAAEAVAERRCKIAEAAETC